MNKATQLHIDIFKRPEYHFRWENHIAFAVRNDEVDIATRDRWVNALQFLQSILGTGFLKSERKHPLHRMITCKDQWGIEELIAFADTLQYFKTSHSNYPKLFSKMRSADLFRREGKPFTEIAAIYLKMGFIIDFPNEIQGQVNPDLLASRPCNGDSFFIEVSELEESEQRNTLKKNYDELWIALENDDYLPYSCQQLRSIAPEEMNNVIAKIREVKLKARKYCLLVHFSDDKIRLAVTHPEKYEQLMQWIEEHDCRKGLLGAPLKFSETKRISNYKIKSEARQIPANETGLIYVPVNTMYFWGIDLEAAITAIECQLQTYKNVLGIVLYGSLQTRVGTSCVCVNRHYFTVKDMGRGVARLLVFVRNSHYTGSLKQETIDAIYTSFE